VHTKSRLQQSLELRACAVFAIVLALLSLQGCGGGDTSSTASALAQELGEHSDAAQSRLELVSSESGVTPFIERLSFYGNGLSSLSTVEYTVQPKTGSVSKAVNITYSSSALTARGYLIPEDGVLKLPVIGLYAGYTNSVALQFQFKDGSTTTLNTNITTVDYVDPSGIYVHPAILQRRAAGSSLGFSFFYMKSALVGSPVIVDTDGEVRWVGPAVTPATSAAFQADEFVIGDPALPIVYRVGIDGTVTQSRLATATYITNFHHNIDYTSIGLLADVTTQDGSNVNFETTVSEITDQGSVLNQWDMAAIISNYMRSMGDDPTAFVRPGIDWFHNNASTYDPSDNSVIISSRENFVIKVDFQTGRIIWILGDPTKYWYTFPSLRAKAVTVAPGGLYPIGQHAVSITPDGLLLLFNDGLGSQNQPAGAPAGESRTYSAVSAYSIDAEALTAKNVWNFENGQTVYSEICSSAYKAPDNSLLIDYAVADNLTHALLLGLNSTHSVVFEFQYPTQSCNTSWNAVPIALENLTIN